MCVDVLKFDGNIIEGEGDWEKLGNEDYFEVDDYIVLYLIYFVCCILVKYMNYVCIIWLWLLFILLVYN